MKFNISRVASAMLCLIIHGSISVTAPLPLPRKQKLPYMATLVGTEWTYHFPGRGEYTVILAESKTANGVTTTKREYEETNGLGIVSERLLVSTSGLFYLNDWVRSFDTPIPWLKPYAKPGDRWTVSTTYSWLGQAPGTCLTFRCSITFVGYEKVNVPAGDFMTMKMHGKFEPSGEETHWYAPGVGLVKRKVMSGAIIVLKSFKLGKVPDK